MKAKIGRVEWAFGSLLLLSLLLAYLRGPFVLGLFVQAALYVVGAWVAIRLAKGAVHKLLWRLRNRLIVAYLFIALVPIVLITALVGLGAALVAGQLSIFLVTSEMERRTNALRSAAEFLASGGRDRIEWLQTVGPELQSRYPGVELTLEDGGRRVVYPPNIRWADMAPDWPTGSGVSLRDGSLVGWARALNGNRRVTAVFPITREYLGQMSPDLGESTILDLDDGKVVLYPNQAGAPSPPGNRLPPAVNALDFEIRWGAPIPVTMWNEPQKTENEWLTIRTRPSAVMRTVFAQKVEAINELVYITFITVAILFLIAEVIALVVGLSLTRTITGAVHELYAGTLRVRTGDFSHRIPIHGRDQLAELAMSFNAMTRDMERLLAIEKERERLQAELEIAREVQNQLYPKKVPEVETLRLTATCNPARMVSGDYYDYQQIGSDRVAIAIGDVAGKGISAALLMATVQSSFRSQIRGTVQLYVSAGAASTRVSVSTSDLVSHLNQQLYADTAPEKYATFYLGVYDETTSTLTYTNAGHLPPVLIRDGDATRLEVNGMVVGAFPFARYGESQIRLLPSDLVVFFTDGISEPENAYGEQFGEDRLIEIVTRNAHLDEREIIDCVMDAVRQWTGSDELQDDMTLLLVRRR